MLLQQSTLQKLPIASVRSGARIGEVIRLVINPHTLHIDAFECRIVGQRIQLLMPDDVFELGPQGIIIRDHDHLLDHNDAIRLKGVLSMQYSLVGKHAYVEKKRIGNIDEIAIDTSSLFIMKFYVTPKMILKFKSSRLVFDRQSVKEVSNQRVVFEDTSRIPFAAPQTAM